MECIVKDKEQEDYRKRYIIETIEQIADENKLGELYYFIKGYLEEAC